MRVQDVAVRSRRPLLFALRFGGLNGVEVLQRVELTVIDGIGQRSYCGLRCNRSGAELIIAGVVIESRRRRTPIARDRHTNLVRLDENAVAGLQGIRTVRGQLAFRRVDGDAVPAVGIPDVENAILPADLCVEG